MENNLKYMFVTESLCCTHETNTILYLNYTSIEKKTKLVWSHTC